MSNKVSNKPDRPDRHSYLLDLIGLIRQSIWFVCCSELPTKVIHEHHIHLLFYTLQFKGKDVRMSSRQMQQYAQQNNFTHDSW